MKIIQAKPLRQTLIAFEIEKSYAGPAPKECHLIIDQGDMAGRVTSVARSEALGKVIGLAYVAPALANIGGKISIRIDGGVMVKAMIVKPPFYDPQGARQKTESATITQVAA